MRKTMRIAGIFLAIMMLFTLTSCTPKTAEKGKEKMEKKGYNVVTTSTDVNIGDLFSTKTEAVLVCSKEVDGKKIAVTAAFYKDAEEAKARYEKVKAENEKDHSTYRGSHDAPLSCRNPRIRRGHRRGLRTGRLGQGTRAQGRRQMEHPVSVRKRNPRERLQLLRQDQ